LPDFSLKARERGAITRLIELIEPSSAHICFSRYIKYIAIEHARVNRARRAAKDGYDSRLRVESQLIPEGEGERPRSLFVGDNVGPVFVSAPRRCGDAYRPLCKSVPTLIFVSINQPPPPGEPGEALIIINAARINRGGTPSRDPPPDPKGSAAIIAVSSITGPIVPPRCAITASLSWQERKHRKSGRAGGRRYPTAGFVLINLINASDRE